MNLCQCLNQLTLVRSEFSAVQPAVELTNELEDGASPALSSCETLLDKWHSQQNVVQIPMNHQDRVARYL